MSMQAILGGIDSLCQENHFLMNFFVKSEVTNTSNFRAGCNNAKEHNRFQAIHNTCALCAKIKDDSIK